MTDVLETVIEAHGGLERWNQLDAVTAWLVRGEPSGASRAMRRSSMTSSSGQACTRSRCRTICSALPTREARSPRSESQSGPPRGTSSNRPWAWPGTAVRCQPDGHAGCAAPRRAGRRAVTAAVQGMPARHGKAGRVADVVQPCGCFQEIGRRDAATHGEVCVLIRHGPGIECVCGVDTAVTLSVNLFTAHIRALSTAQ